MSHNIDIIIILSFLAINLAAGLYFGKGIKNIKEYAVGNRNFSTATIAATLIATWLAADSFSWTAIEVYKQGLYFVIPAIGESLMFFIIAFFYAPRMGEFLGKLSVAEAISSIYGNRVRMITAIFGIFPAIGIVAMQFVVLAMLVSHFLSVSVLYATVISSVIVITYSTFGGIQAVTFTDMIKFFVFAIVVPMTAFLMWKSLSSNNELLYTLKQSPMFNFGVVLDYNNPRFMDMVTLFLFFLIPGLNPAIFQRIVMAKNTLQIYKTFYISGVFVFIFQSIIIVFIGVLLLVANPDNLNENSIIVYILDNYLVSGVKGIFITGVIAMIMSTADSHLNAASVLIAYDCSESIGIKLTNKQELLLVRITSGLIGIAALTLSLFLQNLLNVMVSTFSFYLPIVSVPLILAIFGFRSSSRAVLIGMAAGFLTIIYFKFFSEVDSVIPGMLANIIFFMGSHYILGEAGGWVGIKDKAPLDALRIERKRKIYCFIQSIKNFSLVKFCQNNTPKEERILVYFGLFCMIAVFSNAYSLPRNLQEQYIVILNFIYYSVLTLSTTFITYPFWSPKFKSRVFISLLWNIAVFYNLVFSSSLLAIIGQFDQIQVSVLMASLITVAILMRWQIAMLIIITGVIISIKFYKIYIGINFLPDYMHSLQFKITYSLLLVSSMLIAFLKPKQQYQELTELKTEHLGNRLSYQEGELDKSMNLKYEFLRNLEHEARTPITGITTMGQVLFENYDKLTEKQRQECIETIAKSSERLSSLVNNMIDVSKLSSLNYALNKKQVNLSNLIYDRLARCKTLYLEDKELEFVLNVEENIIINCDEYYIASAIDNLIINAISYSKEGAIIISLNKSDNLIEFNITDEGIGIPNEDLYSIFEPFSVGSRTKTPAGGRGIGLALCKGAIEAHKGRIWCKSNGKKGSIFTFTLPIGNSYEF